MTSKLDAGVLPTIFTIEGFVVKNTFIDTLSGSTGMRRSISLPAHWKETNIGKRKSNVPAAIWFLQNQVFKGKHPCSQACSLRYAMTTPLPLRVIVDIFKTCMKANNTFALLAKSACCAMLHFHDPMPSPSSVDPMYISFRDLPSMLDIFCPPTDSYCMLFFESSLQAVWLYTICTNRIEQIPMSYAMTLYTYLKCPCFFNAPYKNGKHCFLTPCDFQIPNEPWCNKADKYLRQYSLTDNKIRFTAIVSSLSIVPSSPEEHLYIGLESNDKAFE